VSANLIAASKRINANVAGQTRAPADLYPLPSAIGLTATEIGDNLTTGLGSIVSGGVHPEAVPAVVPTALDQPTNSILGPLGGLKPAPGSVLAPGPAGGAAAATAVRLGALPETVASTGRDVVTGASTKITDATTAATRGLTKTWRTIIGKK
jgi:hypothetical protein